MTDTATTSWVPSKYGQRMVVIAFHRGIKIHAVQQLDDAVAIARMPDGEVLEAYSDLYEHVTIREIMDHLVTYVGCQIDDSIEEHAQEYCEACVKYHAKHGNHKCPKCGACHYKFGIHIPDEMYPLSKCSKCGEGHLWD